MVLSVVYVCRDGVMGDRCDVGRPMLTYPGVVDDGIFDTTTIDCNHISVDDQEST